MFGELDILTQTPIIPKQLKRISAVETKYNNNLGDNDITENNDYLETILNCWLGLFKIEKTYM